MCVCLLSKSSKCTFYARVLLQWFNLCGCVVRSGAQNLISSTLFMFIISRCLQIDIDTTCIDPLLVRIAIFMCFAFFPFRIRLFFHFQFSFALMCCYDSIFGGFSFTLSLCLALSLFIFFSFSLLLFFFLFISRSFPLALALVLPLALAFALALILVHSNLC